MICANLTSISRTRCVSGNRSQTLLFIFSLMMKEWQVRQSPIFMALLAATTCSLMLSGGPGRQRRIVLSPISPWIILVQRVVRWHVAYPAAAVSLPPSADDGTACWSFCDEHQTHGRPCRGFLAALLTPGTHTPAAPGWCAYGTAPVNVVKAMLYYATFLVLHHYWSFMFPNVRKSQVKCILDVCMWMFCTNIEVHI